MATSNSQTIKNGHKKAVEYMEKNLINIGFAYARFAITKAVDDWDDDNIGNLTGNIRTGFFAAVFYNGVLVSNAGQGVGGNPMTVYDIPELNIKPPTSGIVVEGSAGFEDYDTGEKIGTMMNVGVKPYNNPKLKFQREDEGYVVAEMIKEKKASLPCPKKKGLCVVVGNATPYANYLRKMRQADILDTQSRTAESVLAECIHSVVDAKQITLGF